MQEYDRYDPNDLLGNWIADYRCSHPQGRSVDCSVANCSVRLGSTFRYVSRASWVRLGRQPLDHEPPQLVVEFVAVDLESANRQRDIKCREFRAAGVQELWVFDRYTHSAKLYGLGNRHRAVRYVGRCGWVTSPLLPGFELMLREFFGIANRWEKY